MSNSNFSKPPSQRQLRVGEEIRHILASILFRGEYRETHLGGISVTVSEVRISPDLKNATAYVMPLGGEKKEATLKALETLAPLMRKLVGNEMKLRYVPKIQFRIDNSFEESHRINLLLQSPEVQRDLKNTED